MKSKHFTCEHPADACPEYCSGTPKGFASNACFVSAVPLNDESINLIGTVESSDVGSLNYLPEVGSQLPQPGDIIINENGDRIEVDEVIDSEPLVTLTYEGDFEVEVGEEIFLLTKVFRKMLRTKGCHTATSLISKQDANDKALVGAMALAAERMRYLVNSQ